ncbi:MAG: DUF4437 domain-containing protein [Verrucomicrobiota bacterium]
MPLIKPLMVFVNLIMLISCAEEPPAPPSKVNILHVSDAAWEPLNPARGDQSPQAATLWGDRKGGMPTAGEDCPICESGQQEGSVPTGFLARFADGFSSPPHIHNVTYRAVVISGLIHNDDPAAEEQWLPPGSFWTQPKGDVHITAAQGDDVMALVEIDQGPYLVMPPEEAFETEEQAMKINAADLEWLDLPGMQPIPGGPKVAYLWGEPADGRPSGNFLKLPHGFEGEIHSAGSAFHAVVIQGQPVYIGGSDQVLDPGSVFSSAGNIIHPVHSDPVTDTILYIRTDARYSLVVRYIR